MHEMVIELSSLRQFISFFHIAVNETIEIDLRKS